MTSTDRSFYVEFFFSAVNIYLCFVFCQMMYELLGKIKEIIVEIGSCSFILKENLSRITSITSRFPLISLHNLSLGIPAILQEFV